MTMDNITIHNDKHWPDSLRPKDDDHADIVIYLNSIYQQHSICRIMFKKIDSLIASTFPELITTKEFQTDNELWEALDNGGTFFVVSSYGGIPTYIETNQVLGTCEELDGVLKYLYNTDNNKVLRQGFWNDIKNKPVFTDHKIAIQYLELMMELYSSSKEWQALVTNALNDGRPFKVMKQSDETMRDKLRSGQSLVEAAKE